MILFLSADVIDSVRIKVSQSRSSQWQQLKVFMYSFRKCFNTSLQNHKLPRSEMFKFLGDEIIFKTTIKENKRFDEFLVSFIDAYHNYAENVDLRLKLSAWIFYENDANCMVKFSDKEDYIGTTMDIGFRISKYATQRKFVVSVEIAYMLSKLKDTNHIRLYYDGKQHTKGLEYDEYPIIWIDADKEKTCEEMTCEDRLLNQNSCDLQDLQDFCKEYLPKSTIKHLDSY